jgi:hypothetical protein
VIAEHRSRGWSIDNRNTRRVGGGRLNLGRRKS